MRTRKGEATPDDYVPGEVVTDSKGRTWFQMLDDGLEAGAVATASHNPDTASMAVIAQLSTALSLKRIADALEGGTLETTMPKGAGHSTRP